MESTMKVTVKKVVGMVGVVLLSGGLLAAPTAFAGEKSSAKSAQVQQIPSKVNVNTASAEEISAVLKGVGLKKAEAIVAYRKANGKFTKVEQLAEVKGIGEATIRKNRDKLVL